MKTTKLSKDNFGDRMKMYENQCTGDVLIPKLPVVVRLDGKSFSSFTRGLKRPYDERLSNLMVETTKYLVKENNFNCGYTQSDEISLVWYFPDDVTQVPYGGKRFKLISDLAAQATLFFNKKLAEYLPEKKDKWPRFDCRVWILSTFEESVNCFVWRDIDATKNSISMASQAFYSHKELNNKNGSEKQEMLFQKGINWNDYPAFFKRALIYNAKEDLLSSLLKN